MKRLAIILALIASPALACQDGERCEQPEPEPVPQGNYRDADRDDGRTFVDITDPEPPLDNGRDRDGDIDR